MTSSRCRHLDLGAVDLRLQCRNRRRFLAAGLGMQFLSLQDAEEGAVAALDAHLALNFDAHLGSW
ncbi:hypothetical protein [Streptomyces sp. ADI98-10]|uniref:hypothetical protein n=1 Tax=Streptomyces sp. ADI98-10 TaxID=1522763 RepID=UPI000F91EC57|nr:hypothetical protein [Streptomyces sp. ADI98-10]RPK92402.1 hypothetical protein EES46_08360 [Streptomyces sp. ADI98-10]